MTAEALLQEWPDDLAGLMRQQLRLHAMDAGRLLQRLDDMRKQSLLNLAPVRRPASIADEQVADHALALLINEKRVAENTPALNRRIARQSSIQYQISQARSGVVRRQRANLIPTAAAEVSQKVLR